MLFRSKTHAKSTAKLVDLADPLDAGAFRVNPREIDPDALDAAYTARDYETVVREALRTVAPTFVQPPEFYRPYAAYYLALAHLIRGDFDRALPLLDQVGFDAPPDVMGLLPYDLRQASRMCAAWQDRAIDAGKPSAIIYSLPKSASAFLSHNISAAFDIPIVRSTVGGMMLSLAVPRWVEQVRRGGAVTHEHPTAHQHNVATVGQVWVQVRDPRDAVFSAQNMTGVQGNVGRTQAEKFAKAVANYARFIDGWFPHAQLVTFEEVTSDLPGTIERIMGSCPRFDPVSVNARKGTGGEWRALPDDVKRDAWNAIPERVRDRLALHP